MVYIYGIIGFVAFETWRIYKRLWAGKPIPPFKNRWIYAVIVVLMASVSGAIAGLMSHGSAIEALLLGFSIPSSLNMILERRPRRSGVAVDDIILNNRSKFGFWITFREYFTIDRPLDDNR
jgi:hypothetical protein